MNRAFGSADPEFYPSVLGNRRRVELSLVNGPVHGVLVVVLPVSVLTCPAPVGGTNDRGTDLFDIGSTPPVDDLDLVDVAIAFVVNQVDGRKIGPALGDNDRVQAVVSMRDKMDHAGGMVFPPQYATSHIVDQSDGLKRSALLLRGTGDQAQCDGQ